MFKKTLFAVAFLSTCCFSSLVACAADAPAPTTNTINDIVVGNYPTNMNVGLYVAHGKGYFEKNRLNVKLQEFHSGPEIADAVKQGKIDVGLCGIIPLLEVINNGGKVKIVAPVNTGGLELAVAKNSHIKTLQGLKGKKIAIYRTKTTQEFMLKYLLQHTAKLQLSDVTIVEMPEKDMVTAVYNKQIDGFLARSLITAEGLQKKLITVIPIKDKVLKNFPFVVVIATDDLIANRPEVLKSFLQAHHHAVDFWNKNRKESLAIIAKIEHEPLANTKKALTMLQTISHPTSSYLKSMEEVFNLAKEDGYLQANVEFKNIYDFSFLPKD
jgi:NitT/TauT family transport system substrate-binding protein